MSGPRALLLKIFLFFQLQHGVVTVAPAEVTIGFIWPSGNKQDAIAGFKAAVDYVNNEGSILPSTNIKYIINETDTLHPLMNVQKACYQISNGVTAIIGPLTSTDVKAVSTITSQLKVPIYTPSATNPAFSTDHTNFPYLLRMIPSDVVTAHIIADIFEQFFWKRFAILASNSDYANGATAQLNLIAIEKEWSLTTTQKFEAIDNPSSLDIQSQLNAIKENGVRIVLVVAVSSYTPIIMNQAKELNMINGWAWIVMDPRFNITSTVPDEAIGLLSVRPVTNQGTLHGVFNTKLTAAGFDTNHSHFLAVKIFDSVISFAQGLHNFFQAGYNLSTESPTCGSCKGDSSSKKNGDILMSYLKKVQTNGASHFLNFTTNGSPGLAIFEVVNLQKTGWKTVGSWNTNNDLSLDAAKRLVTWPGVTTDIPVDMKYNLGNTTLKIVTILEPGFLQLKPGKTLSDPDPLEGLCIDFIKRLAEDMHFQYTLSFVQDGKYGSHDANNEWNGMVGELIDEKHDMILAPITITQHRSEVIDFTKPFMDLGLTILMKLPTKSETNMFGFVDPFSREVWLCSIVLMITIALITLFLDKVSPNGYYGSVVQHRLEEECDESDVQQELDELTYLNLTNSMWFSIGALLQQGGDVLPRSISGRTLAAFWWAASMILIATYTANLAAFLTFNRMKPTITSVEQLASQIYVKYGTVYNSPAQEFFENSMLPSFNGMFYFMETSGTLVQNITTGVQRVKNENFALIYDSLFLIQETYKEPCDVYTVGKLFGKFGYGLGFQKNSPFTTRFSLEILHLRETGFIVDLKEYWFKNKGDCTPDMTMLQPSTGQLTLEDMIGVLYCVYMGIGLGLVLIVVEWCVASYWEVDPTDPMKPNSWREAMKRRMGRIWEDICKRWPAKLKCFKKSRMSSNNVRVLEVKNCNETENQVKKVKPGVENKGYKGETVVHPFQVTEK